MRQFVIKNVKIVLETKTINLGYLLIRDGVIAGSRRACRSRRCPGSARRCSRWTRGRRIDPLQYLKEYVVDKTRPIAHAFMAYPIEGKGVFCGSVQNHKTAFGPDRKSVV